MDAPIASWGIGPGQPKEMGRVTAIGTPNITTSQAAPARPNVGKMAINESDEVRGIDPFGLPVASVSRTGHLHDREQQRVGGDEVQAAAIPGSRSVVSDLLTKEA